MVKKNKPLKKVSKSNKKWRIIDNKKLMPYIVAIAIIIIGTVIIFAIDSGSTIDVGQDFGGGNQDENFKSYFSTAITDKAVEINNGLRPIEGFSPLLLKNTFSNLNDRDFDNVKAMGGRYDFVNNKLVFKEIMVEGEPITSAYDTISQEGYLTLLDNLSSRFSMEINSVEDIDALVARIN